MTKIGHGEAMENVMLNFLGGLAVNHPHKALFFFAFHLVWLTVMTPPALGRLLSGAAIACCFVFFLLPGWPVAEGRLVVGIAIASAFHYAWADWRHQKYPAQSWASSRRFLYELVLLVPLPIRRFAEGVWEEARGVKKEHDPLTASI